MTMQEHHHHDRAVIAAPAEDLCLAFANTRYWRGRDQPTETFFEFSDLLAWLKANTMQSALPETAQWAGDHAPLAARYTAEAVELREAIYRLFTAVATGDPVPDSEIIALNTALAAGPARVRLIRRQNNFGWSAPIDEPTIPTLLAPILWSAADLLTHADDRRVRRCANDECLWLFMDHSKGGTRRWCDMNSCGNRAKSKRHYLRAKQDRN